MFTPLKLEKVRNLRYGMKALSIVEKELGTTIAKLDFENLTIEQQTIILWAGLLHEDKDLTVDHLMDLIDDHSSMMDAFGTMAQAIAESFGSNEKKPEKKTIAKK